MHLGKIHERSGADLAVKDIRRAFEASELECTVCAIRPPGINPISSDAAVRKVSVQHLIKCIETASALVPSFSVDHSTRP